MKMPEKDPSNWQLIFSLMTPQMQASICAVFFAGLRILYEAKEGKSLRKVLESLMCGALTYSAASLLSFFTLPDGVSIGIGGMIGLFGADYVREKARKIFEKRIESDDITKS